MRKLIMLPVYCFPFLGLQRRRRLRTGWSATPAACRTTARNSTCWIASYYWYLWNDLLPPNISIADYASPEELVSRGDRDFWPAESQRRPLDFFSSVGSRRLTRSFSARASTRASASAGASRAPTCVSAGFLGQPRERGRLQPRPKVLASEWPHVADIGANEGIRAALDVDTVEFEIQSRYEHIYGIRHKRHRHD